MVGFHWGFKGLKETIHLSLPLMSMLLPHCGYYMVANEHTRFAPNLTEIQVKAGFPLGLENLEKWEGIFQSGKSQGILNRLEKSGKSQGKSHKILEN